MLPVVRSTSSLPDFMNELFNDTFWNQAIERRSGISVPAVNIVENTDDYRIEIAAPGIGKNDFKINLDNNTLSISAQKETSNESKNEKYVRREFGYSSFKRTFVLPDDVNADQISASHNEGILVLSIPKKEEAKPKPARSIAIA